jgi:5-methylthioadenosine/S-adenosylhomocysteine deaminase
MVWGTDGRSVRDVVVAGQVVIRDGRCTTVDEDELRIEARARQRDLLARAGIEIPHRWEIR